MAPLRSLGNIRSAFEDFYARTGKDAAGVRTIPFESTGGTKITNCSDTYHVFLYTGSPQSFTVTVLLDL